MSQGAVIPASAAAEPRHRILPFVNLWRRNKIMVFYGSLVLLIGFLITELQTHKLDWPILMLGVLLFIAGVALHFGVRRHYVMASSDGLWINGLSGHELIPFPEIRQVRCQPLDVFFSSASRKGKMLRSLKPFQKTLALEIRVDRQPGELARLGRGLGRGCVVEQDLILLVADAKGLERRLQGRVRRRPPGSSRRR
ncbi:MAG: hypothetical protein ACREOL_01450 [Candidatus Dormibacteria bacterium]